MGWSRQAKGLDGAHWEGTGVKNVRRFRCTLTSMTSFVCLKDLVSVQLLSVYQCVLYDLSSYLSIHLFVIYLPDGDFVSSSAFEKSTNIRIISEVMVNIHPLVNIHERWIMKIASRVAAVAAVSHTRIAYAV